MLSARTKPFLYGKWQRERSNAIKDPTVVSQTGRFGLDDLEVDAGVGKENPEIYKIDSNPVDSETGKKTDRVDVREWPGFD